MMYSNNQESLLSFIMVMTVLFLKFVENEHKVAKTFCGGEEGEWSILTMFSKGP